MAQIVARNKHTVGTFYERLGLHRRYREVYLNHIGEPVVGAAAD